MLYSVLPSFVLGFHGCDRAVARAAIARKRPLKYSLNNYDWLGSGIYFWENSPSRAMDWARQQKRLGHIREPAVIGAIINPGNCLNLLDSRYLQIAREAYESMAEAARKAGTELPKNRPLRGSREHLLRHLDCAVINFAHEQAREKGLPPFDTVRAAFIEGDELYPGSAFRDRNHIQICVRSMHCIKGYFHPLDEPPPPV